MEQELICASIQTLYLCGSDHVTNSSVQCLCGERNLVSLSAILNRVIVKDSAPINVVAVVQESGLVQQLWDLPSMRAEFGDN